MHLLCILFRNPNFLVLDEPTNDLDLPTLGVLENFLSEFTGCLLIVSHDRYFMDRLTDHIFVFEGDGMVRDFPGNYSDYRKSDSEEGNRNQTAPSQKSIIEEPAIKTSTKKQLSFKEKREFDQLEKEIENLTKEKAQVTEKLNTGELPFTELEQLSHRITELTQQLDEKEMRWLHLSEISSG